jgi:glycosyltransferase involved in cell wall biosynthesis
VLERFLYRRSAAVTVLSEDLRENVAAKLGRHRPERVHVIPNFVDTDRIRPAPKENAYRDEYGLRGSHRGHVRRQRGDVAVARPGRGRGPPAP